MPRSRCSRRASRLNLRPGQSTVCASSSGRIEHRSTPPRERTTPHAVPGRQHGDGSRHGLPVAADGSGRARFSRRMLSAVALKFQNEGRCSPPLATCIIMARWIRREAGLWPRKKPLRRPSLETTSRWGSSALVMKQAIEYNLAGSARNDANQVVRFTLQGKQEADRLGRRNHSKGDRKIV